MEHAYFDVDHIPSDIWRLIFKKLTILTELRSFNSINNYHAIILVNTICKSRRYGLVYLKKDLDWSMKQILFPRSCLQNCFASNKRFDQRLILPTMIFNLINLKIVVIGDGGVGKTSFIKLITGRQMNSAYIPNIGCEVHPLTVTSNKQNYQLVFWYTGAGPERFGGLRNGYYIGAVAAIIMSDVTSRVTMKNIPTWLRDLRRTCGDIPTAVCVNKLDVLPEKLNFVDRVLSSAIKASRKQKAMFCEISNRARFSVHEPLIWILQQLTGDETLMLQFPPFSPYEYNKLNPITLNALINARRKALENIEDEDDDFLDFTREHVDKTSSEFYEKAKEKRKVLESVIQSCSPRVKSVMESLLTGVRIGPALRMNHHPLQKPSLLFVEGLECNEFHSTEKFNFVQPFLEFYKQHENDIIMETKTLMGNSGLDDIISSINGSWKSLYFIESGKVNEKSHEIAPLLTQMLQGVTSLMKCSFGYAYISILGPHSHITPHYGPCTIKLRCHLPLIVPSEGCTIRVGTITKSFKQGELLIFDDSFEHEVCNDSDSSRVVLLFDIWHPDLTTGEINSFSRYFC